MRGRLNLFLQWVFERISVMNQWGGVSALPTLARRLAFTVAIIVACVMAPSLAWSAQIQILFDELRVDRHGERGALGVEPGDEPYLIVVQLRSRWMTPGSTMTKWSRFAGRVGINLKTGAQRSINTRIGFIEFRDVNPVPISAVVGTTRARPEFFLALVVAMESDNWTASGRRNAGDQIANALARHVAPLIENGELNIFDPGSDAEAVKAAIRADLVPDDFLDKLEIFVTSGGDPDEFINSHAVAVMGLTDSMTSSSSSLTLLSGVGRVTRDTDNPLRFRKSSNNTRWSATASISMSGCLPIYSWYSGNRGDNFLTSDPGWQVPLARARFASDGAAEHLEQQPSSGDGLYRLHRREGYAFDPRGPQPTGTVPLVSWWAGSREDNFATTDPRWNIPTVRWAGEHLAEQPRSSDGMYVGYRVEGFIFDPRQPQPTGTVPLFSWYAGEREDNFATTDPRWRISPIRWDGEHLADQPTSVDGMYRGYRLEGYVFDPKGPFPGCE